MMSAENRTSVLLVDDDADICETIQSGLERHGFRVTTFNDPTEALSRYAPKLYDKVVLDVKMPGITGFHLAKKIWAIDPEAKICFFSAFDIYEKEAKTMFKDFRTAFFIKKPIGPSELAKRITENMQRYK